MPKLLCRIERRIAKNATPWFAVDLVDDDYVLTGEGVRRFDDGEAVGCVRLVATAPLREWLAIGGGDVAMQVNGAPLDPLRIHALRHRDQIQCGPLLAFFSDEVDASVVAYDGPVDAVCSRCSTDLQPGRPVRRTPCCGSILHEDPDLGLSCFSYHRECPSCRQPLPDNGSPLFDPREL